MGCTTVTSPAVAAAAATAGILLRMPASQSLTPPRTASTAVWGL